MNAVYVKQLGLKVDLNTVKVNIRRAPSSYVLYTT